MPYCYGIESLHLPAAWFGLNGRLKSLSVCEKRPVLFISSVEVGKLIAREKINVHVAQAYRMSPRTTTLWSCPDISHLKVLH